MHLPKFVRSLLHLRKIYTAYEVVKLCQNAQAASPTPQNTKLHEAAVARFMALVEEDP